MSLKSPNLFKVNIIYKYHILHTVPSPSGLCRSSAEDESSPSHQHSLHISTPAAPEAQAESDSKPDCLQSLPRTRFTIWQTEYEIKYTSYFAVSWLLLLSAFVKNFNEWDNAG